MSVNCFQRLPLLLILLAITLPSFQLNWQGTGDMNSTVMTEINTLITNNPITSPNTPDADDTAQIISTRLNSLWDPAWNVFLIKQGKQFDSVVYGYAFNNHWMWINGIPVNGDSTKIWAYIIWKDYNCQNWGKINIIHSQGSTMDSSVDFKVLDIRGTGASNIVFDVWTYAYKLIVNLEGPSTDHAYSIIISQDGMAQRAGYICLTSRNFLNYNGLYYDQNTDTSYGAYYIFQTR